MCKVIPDYNHYDHNHWYIWHCLAHDLTKDDFEAIQMALIEREDEHEAIDKSKRMFVEFDKENKMMQPRAIPEFMKEEAHRYVDWDCAFKIWMILTKYADIYSKKTK